MNLIRLDGAMGTELTRRGVDTTLPLWSAMALDTAPEIVTQIHADYITAGARVITSNTFRTNTRALAKAGAAYRHRAAELTQRAVDLARAAITGTNTPGVRIAGSMAPVEDCYTPDLVPAANALAAEHAELARNLNNAGVDFFLIETMNSIREANAAACAAAVFGKPLWISFTLAADNTLLSGETLSAAVHAVRDLKPEAVLVNCIPVAQVASALRVLAAACENAALTARIGAYGNVGHVDDTVGWTLTHAVAPEAYAACALEWRALGASVIGGCCGTLPAHIAALRGLT